MLWAEEETWKSLGKAYRLMKSMKAGFRTQFVQAAYAECWVARKLVEAGYDVRFHEKGCDLSVVLSGANSALQKVKFEVKHSEDNKEPDKYGHGFASWVISRPQVEDEKFDLCVLVRDSLRREEPDAAYVFRRQEIAKTKPVEVNAPKLDYYLWDSEYFEDIIKEDEWMRLAVSPLVGSLHRNPALFQNRWIKILSGGLQSLMQNNVGE
jgi:hypothetical protein